MTDHGPGPGGIRRSSSIFRQAAPQWLALAPLCSGGPPPRQPCRVQGGAAGFRRYLPRVALTSLLAPAGLSPPFACWAFPLEETPQEAAGSFTSRDLKVEQLDPAGRIVPQGSWSWQAVVPIIAWISKSLVRIWLETGSNFPADAVRPPRSTRARLWHNLAQELPRALSITGRSRTRAAPGGSQIDGQEDQSIMGPPPEGGF